MELTQGMELAQVLKLSPGLLQSMEMLQMNTLELGAYLKELALENPVLEEAEPGRGRIRGRPLASQVPWLGDTPWTGQTAQEGDWGRGESPTESLAFLLEEQLARRGLLPELLAVCRYLAGLLDDDGRLDPEDLAELRTAGVPAELLERGVEVLQSLEPAGVGARSLEECLLLQLRRAARGAYSGPSYLSGPFGGTEQGALWGVGPAAGGHPAAGGGGSPGDPRPLPQPGGGRGGSVGGCHSSGPVSGWRR